MNVDDTIVSPHVPPDTLGGWITTVRGLVEEVEMNRELERLPARAISTRLRGLLEQMRAAAYGRSR